MNLNFKALAFNFNISRKGINLSFEKRSTGTSTLTNPASWLTQLLGSSTEAGMNISEAKALALTVVWACIDIKSDVFASFPYHVYQKTNEGKGRQKYTDHPLHQLLTIEPNPIMSIFDYRKAIAVQVLKNGNCIILPKRNGLFEVTEFYMPETRKDITIKEKDGDLHYWYKGQHYHSWEVLHYKWLTLDGRCGVDPIKYHRETFGLGRAALLFGSQVLQNGSIQPSVLETDRAMKLEDAKDIRDSFAGLYAGLEGGKRQVPLLHSGLKMKSAILEPEKAQFLGTKEHVIEEVCRIYNMPPAVVHHHLRSTFTNAEQQDLSFLKYSMGPFVKRIEDEDKRKLLTEEEKRSGQVFFKHNVDSLLRTDFEKRAEGYSKLINSGVMDRNEARAKEEMDWKEGLDEDLINVSAMPSSTAKAYYEAKIKNLEAKAGTESNNNES